MSLVPRWLVKNELIILYILFSGAGESGKSTLVKQMKIIHNDGFTRDELESFKPTVMDNLLSSMKYVLGGMGILRINLQSAKNKVLDKLLLWAFLDRCCPQEIYVISPIASYFSFIFICCNDKVMVIKSLWIHQHFSYYW